MEKLKISVLIKQADIELLHKIRTTFNRGNRGKIKKIQEKIVPLQPTNIKSNTTMKFTLRIWRQQDAQSKGRF